MLYNVAASIAWRREVHWKEAEDLRTVDEMRAVVVNSLEQLRDSVRHPPNEHGSKLVGLRNVTAAKNPLRGFMAEVFEAFHRMAEEPQTPGGQSIRLGSA